MRAGGLASLTLKSSAKGSPLKSEPAPEKLKKENDECSGCFFVLGVGAVSFGCGHAVSGDHFLTCLYVDDHNTADLLFRKTSFAIAPLVFRMLCRIVPIVS